MSDKLQFVADSKVLTIRSNATNFSLSNNSYSTDILKAALVAKGANTIARTNIAPSNKSQGFVPVPLTVA